MAVDIAQLGKTSEPFDFTVEAERTKLYAAATNDPNEAYASGEYAPPVFGVVPVFDAMGASSAGLIPQEFLFFIVHGEQDMHFNKPLVPGMTLKTQAEALSTRVGGSGTRLAVKVISADAADGSPVMEQYITTFIRGMADGESAGPDKPDHTFPDDARSNKVGEFSVHVDDDQTFRYRDASGDQMPIHVDNDFAKSVGLPGIIAHGLCTMAMTSQAVIKTVADGDPSRLKRLAVRFSKNVFPGNDVVTSIYDAGEENGRKVYAFEAHSNGDLVIANGRAEIEA